MWLYSILIVSFTYNFSIAPPYPHLGTNPPANRNGLFELRPHRYIIKRRRPVVVIKLSKSKEIEVLSYLDVGNYTTIKKRASQILSVVTTKQKRAASPSPIHRSPKQNYRVPIGQSARAVDTCHSPGLPLSFMSPYAIRIRPIIYADADADADVEIDADVPHVRMRIFASSLICSNYNPLEEKQPPNTSELQKVGRRPLSRGGSVEEKF
ncbi:hypothetical protein EVAR_76982_1 [Eumeta japonica]|uniref:Uncharacterized protein n=1 Tax=Eumeta variegata TaxID=151549 RepID=A0A4C1SI15_EUMVA|nr:hypothetical protein EVAR_76982_1 [Eumeta japonica]